MRELERLPEGVGHLPGLTRAGAAADFERFERFELLERFEQRRALLADDRNRDRSRDNTHRAENRAQG